MYFVIFELGNGTLVFLKDDDGEVALFDSDEDAAAAALSHRVTARGFKVLRTSDVPKVRPHVCTWDCDDPCCRGECQDY